MHLNRCCNCTKHTSKCKRNCSCRQSKQFCSNCDCIHCENKDQDETISQTRQDYIIDAGGAFDLNEVIGNDFIEKGPDLEGYVLSEVDQKMDAVYGDHVHNNDGTHLHGDITDDPKWQLYWKKLVILPSKLYDLPKGKVAHDFLEELCALFEGIQQRKWNSEKIFVFIFVVLQKNGEVKKAGDIKKRIATRIIEWKKNNFNALVDATDQEMRANMSNKRGRLTVEKIHKIFTHKMLAGKIREAVRFLCESSQGGILMPDEIDSTTGLTVEEILKSKHPTAKTPDKLPEYQNLPALIDINITADTVEKVSKNLSGAAGLGGFDSKELSRWLLQYGTRSEKLRKTIAEFTSWLANDNPPWAAYRALMSGRLLALDKCPGIRPIGIGETFRRLMAKLVIAVTRNEAQIACGVDQLCAGLQAGIEGGIHAVQQIWESHKEEEDWGFLMIDARNAFNEINRTTMLWVIRHEWPAGARFCFNCYKHHAILINRGDNGNSSILASREGVTQGDPLSMFCYGIGILPLIRQLKSEFPKVFQLWYADDGGTGGNFQSIKALFQRLQEKGPEYGYYPEPTKSILVVSPENAEQAKFEFGDMGFKVVTGNRYLGSFLGDSSKRDEWIMKKIDQWILGIQKLAVAARSNPQCAYIALQKSLQQQWQYLQRTTENISELFIPIQRAIHDTFLPALFGETIALEDYRHELSQLSIKNCGLALPNPVESAMLNHQSSTDLCAHLVESVLGKQQFEYQIHKATMTSAREVSQSVKLKAEKEKFSDLMLKLPVDTRRTLERGKETGTWLSIAPTIVQGTVLSSQEFRDSLHLRYSRTPPDLPKHCDGCGSKFSIEHALQCKKGGLVNQRHNEIRDELCEIAARAIIPSAVRDEPLIHPCRLADDNITAIFPEENLVIDNNGDRGDVLIRGLWSNGTDCILDVRVTDTNAATYARKDPKEVLAKQEREKKKKYLQACLDQRRHFSPFVVSCDGLLGKEAQAVLQNLASRLSKKTGKSYSEACGFMRARISIAIVRATHLCIRGSRIPTNRMSRHPQWEDGAGIGLFQFYS